MDNPQPPTSKKPRTPKPCHPRRWKPPVLQPSVGLEREIEMLRMLLRWVMAKANEGSPLEESLRILESAGKASIRLATLLRTEKILTGDKQSEVMSTLSLVLQDIYKDIACAQPLE